MIGGSKTRRFLETAAERILILDGATGSRLQEAHPELSNHISTRGSGLLSLSHPETICQLHLDYLRAGADIISTNSFDFGRECSDPQKAAEAAACLAQQAVHQYGASASSGDRWVAGVVGPGRGRIAEDAGAKWTGDLITADMLAASYRSIVGGLVGGGVDLLLVETIVGSTQAAIACAVIGETGGLQKRDLPIWLSVTLDPSTGLLLSGESLSDFAASLPTDKVVALGVNCVRPDPNLRKALTTLSKAGQCLISVHPSASGLDPTQAAVSFAESIAVLAASCGVNIVGSCCGSSPEYTSAMADRLRHVPPRPVSLSVPGDQDR